MSLTSALYSSFAGLANTEARLSVTSSNVTNADNVGYTQKEYTTQYSTTNAGTVPVSGTIESVNVNPYLLKTIISETSTAAKSAVESEYLSEYSSDLGSIEGSSTLSSTLTELMASFDTLSVTPEDTSLKSQAVSDAENLAYQLNELSSAVQDLRARADQELEQAVAQANTSLEKLESLNSAIEQASIANRSTANLEDERNVELEALSSLLDIDYFTTGENQIHIYASGRPLLTSSAQTLTYTASNEVNSTVTYPTILSGIELGGVDITSTISEGTIGGLIEIRDVTLVEEQQKLDALANTLMEQTNTLLNQGASLPSRTEFIGDTDGLSAATSIAGSTGSVRIATTDQGGLIVATNDFDLSTYATLSDLITDINATFAGDITASISADGGLQIMSNITDQGIAINELDSNMTGAGDGFSAHFGLNNLYTGTGAENIQISAYLSDNPEYLATSMLSDNSALAAGDAGIYAGDGSLAKALNEIFTTDVSFNAAGNFAAQNESLDGYASKVMSDIASRANEASEDAETTSYFLEYTKTTLENLTGVNINEEMTNLIDLEEKYNSAATMIGAIQDMFDQLLAAVR